MKKLIILLAILSLIAFSCSEKVEDSNVSDDVYVKEENLDVLEPDVEIDESDENIETETEIIDVPDDEIVIEDDVVEVKTEYVDVTDIKLSLYDVSLFVGGKRMPIVTMYPQNATDKGEIWVSSDTSVATVDNIGNITAVSEGECTVTVTSTSNNSVSAKVSVKVKANPECTYIDGILVVNKTYALPSDYAPGWETEASPRVAEMIAAAKKEGLNLWVKSGYRSYYDQQYIYNNYVVRDGQEEADTYSARPGHSEHQTGLAYDMNTNDQGFGETPEGIWLAENCHKFGFIIRYPKEKEHITGYIYEPWHIRYLGVEKATEVYESGLCLEEFLNITSQYS